MFPAHYFKLFSYFFQSHSSFLLSLSTKLFFSLTLAPQPILSTSLHLAASAGSLVSFLCDCVPSLPLFNLIKENAIQLSFSWPIASFSPTSYCYSLTLYACQSGTQPMLFRGMDEAALAIMTFLLVSHSHSNVPEDTVPPFWMSPVILSCSVFFILRA